MNSPVAVLDASALLAYLQGEPGAERVAEVLVIGAAISSVNWAETLTKLAERGQDPEAVATQLRDRGLLNPWMTCAKSCKRKIDMKEIRKTPRTQFPQRKYVFSRDSYQCQRVDSGVGLMLYYK